MSESQSSFAFTHARTSDPTTSKRAAAKKTCFHCGASMNEYRHSLSKSLARALFKVWSKSGGKPINLKHVGLTRNEWDNFQKLRYFGLVKQIGSKTGVWQVTQYGEEFLFGEKRVPKTAVTYRGEFVKFEGSGILFSDATGYYYSREHYAQTSSPRDEGLAE